MTSNGATDTQRPLLFTPITLRGVTARNRIVVSPMCQYVSVDGGPTDWQFVHFGRYAMGGAGIVFGEESAVEARGRKTYHCAGIWNDHQARAYRRITDFIKQMGAVPAIQLGHCGRNAGSHGALEDWRALDERDARVGMPPWRGLAPSPLKMVVDTQEDEWARALAINLTSCFVCCKAVLPGMLERRWGRIIHISSIMGLTSAAGRNAYSATKSALFGLARASANDLGTFGITVNCLCPSTTDTPMVHNRPMYGLFAPDVADPTKETVRHRYEAMNPMRLAWLDPQEIADVAAFLVSDAARHISGAVYEISAGGSGAQL